MYLIREARSIMLIAMTNWMIYGANGYTGELIVEEALRRDHHPIVAGRNRDAVESLAKRHQLEARVFDLDSPSEVERHVDGVDAVLHCAGPFLRTSRPMVAACLAAGAHYLDITGEIAVFESVLAKDARAKKAGVALIPGVGFDVVPTDTLAAILYRSLPDATHLDLAFYMKGGGTSRGTRRTMIEGLGGPGAIRRDGKIVPVPVAFDVREIPFSCGPRNAVTFPWGDVSTAYHTTGIPNIRVYAGASPRAVRRLRLTTKLAPLLRWAPVRRLLQRFAGQGGPDTDARRHARVYLWGEARNEDGERRAITAETLEGYTFTALSAVRAIERLSEKPPEPGSWTPAKIFGAGFLSEIEGTVIHPVMQ